MQNENFDARYVQEWTYIPEQAFLYFPTGEEVKTGTEEKQWRKIFQNGDEYEPFERNALAQLEQKLKEKNVALDPWLDTANQLRFLQANKFKVSNTLDSMIETTKWRTKQFPFSIDEDTIKMLNSGALYFCGRDCKYRPIIVADIGKFNADDVQLIPKALVAIMQFMIKNLLVEGQVQNYIMIMNLQQANFSLRNVIMKILSFTNNAYRGRMFASYILSMPTIIRWGWDGIVSKIVSENTLKKIKITGDKIHEDMWTHISKETIEEQYGGTLPNLKNSFWPPNGTLLKFVDRSKEILNKLKTPSQYRLLYQSGKLSQRKILEKYVFKETVKPVEKVKVEVQVKQQVEEKLVKLNETPRVRSEVSRNSPPTISLPQSSALADANSRNMMIRIQTSFIKDYHSIKTFFQTPSFMKICGEVSSH